MKFEIAGVEQKKVKLELVNVGGDVALRANGTEILWVRERGDLLLNCCDVEQLRSAGFEMRGNRVKCSHESEK